MKKEVCMLVFSLVLNQSVWSQTVTVSTFAGSTVHGSSDGQGAAASFYYPVGIGTDAAGNVYVADQQMSLIRKITPSGLVSTLAGTGSWGTTNGQGTAASFDDPHGIAVDADNNLYVIDSGNNRIRKITPSGLVSTFAGSAYGNVDGQGTAASFRIPTGIDIDTDGNLYVADWGNNSIRKVTPSGLVSTLAGSGAQGSDDGQGTAASFWEPTDVTVDASGNVYVADYNNNKIRKITPSGLVSTYAGTGVQGSTNGIASVAKFKWPSGLAVDALGNVYVSDTGNDMIRMISPLGVVSTLAGTGSAGSQDGNGTTASFFSPEGIAIDVFGNIYLADYTNNEIRKIISSTVTAIEQNEPSQVLSIVPNPVQNSLTVSFNETMDTYEILNSSGVSIQEGVLLNNNVDVHTLPEGIYFLKLINTKDIKTFRFLKE